MPDYGNIHTSPKKHLKVLTLCQTEEMEPRIHEPMNNRGRALTYIAENYNEIYTQLTKFKRTAPIQQLRGIRLNLKKLSNILLNTRGLCGSLRMIRANLGERIKSKSAA